MGFQVLPIIMAAGASSRMKAVRSKLLHPLLGKEIICRAYDQAKAIGSEKPLFVLGHQRDELIAKLKDYVGESEFEVAIQDPPQGTGDAIRVALQALEDKSDDTHILIMGGDTVLIRPESLKKFLEEYFSKKAVLSFLTAELPDAGAYGRVIRNSDGAVSKIVEAKNASIEELRVNEMNMGFYLVSLGRLKEEISGLQRDAKSGEFYLTDIVHSLMQKRSLVLGHTLRDWTESLGVNTQADLAQATSVLQQRINLGWMTKGVFMRDPASIWIEEGVKLGSDVRLQANIELRGSTQVEDNVEIASHCILQDTHIGKGSQVLEFCHFQEANIGPKCVLGPFARLRPKAELQENVKIGNFVEVKKSHFASGAKANHLSYIGDTEVGPKTNIGAGTITCNYDGYLKSKTKLGAGVFIGSNSSLVAPVEVGEGAIVGAGSVITENVPSDAIAVERNEQKNKDGAAKRFRDKRSGA